MLGPGSLCQSTRTLGYPSPLPRFIRVTLGRPSESFFARTVLVGICVARGRQAGLAELRRVPETLPRRTMKRDGHEKQLYLFMVARP